MKNLQYKFLFQSLQVKVIMSAALKACLKVDGKWAFSVLKGFFFKCSTLKWPRGEKNNLALHYIARQTGI